jgi:hypothetical protein
MSALAHHESDAGHHIDPAHIPAAISWLGRAESPPSDSNRDALHYK